MTEGFKFGGTSRRRLNTCHPQIVAVMEEALSTSEIDFTIVCGHRGKEDQEKAFAAGASKVRFPSSRHNAMPSEAVDVCPWVEGKLAWDNVTAYHDLAMHIKETAARLGVKITWGGEWTKFVDKPHFELTRPVKTEEVSNA
jgi:peptidoglycan L-alanyl-D-glutamate endopeptidase CwlK